MIYFTSDTHYFHENIIKFCARPFYDTEEMNQALIDNWNKVVGKRDTVYHLGDVTFGDAELTQSVLGQLNGKKLLIPGNHDRVHVIGKMFDEVLPQYFELNVNRLKIPLCHFPLEQFRGTFHLHGHSHGSSKQRNKRRDVGVDCYNFTPVSLDQLVMEISNDREVYFDV